MRSLMGFQMWTLCVDLFTSEELTFVYPTFRVRTVIMLSLVMFYGGWKIIKNKIIILLNALNKSHIIIIILLGAGVDRFVVEFEFVVLCAMVAGILWFTWMKRVTLTEFFPAVVSRTMALLGRWFPFAVKPGLGADDTLNIDPWRPSSAISVASLLVRIVSGDDGGVSVGKISFALPVRNNLNSIAFSVFIWIGILLKLCSIFSSQLSEFSSSSSIFSFFTTTAQLNALSHDTPEHADDIELVDNESKLWSW